ncbi:hypothetical protein FRC06_006225 [Ceratobasidium sp. 370]|nr:hypothetical protein FRC06_006225 [Ceratobasidium sp. 370]
MHRLFVTQELVAAICARLYAEFLLERNAGSKKFRRTALVSTYFFHGMLPYIWKSVKLADLFTRRLIPAEILAVHNWVQVHISQSVTRETMSRFHLYAPYIEVLEVPGGFYILEINNWEPLVEYSKDNKLLPNLAEIKCEKFDPDPLSVFLPSTRKLTIDSSTQLNMADAQQLLEQTANLCPGLHSLEFYPETVKRTGTALLSHTFASLSSFKDLRHLVSTPVVIQSKALQLVAQLPHLNTLSIGLNEGDTHWDSSSCEPVPAGGFPALTDLTLHLDKIRDAMRFWELVPLGKLKRLNLALSADDDESPLISTICMASPRITQLGLTFVDYRKWSEWFYEISADMFEYLARLSLVCYAFDRAKFDFEDAWAKVAGAWPNLRFINCLIQSTTLEDLVFLSSNLPKLEAIECGLCLDDAVGAVETDWLPVGQPSFYPQLRHLAFNLPDIAGIMQCNLQGEERASKFRDLARFLAYSWPKLSMVAVEDEEEEEESASGKDYYPSRYELRASQWASFTLFNELVLSYVKIYHGA